MAAGGNAVDVAQDRVLFATRGVPDAGGPVP